LCAVSAKFVFKVLKVPNMQYGYQKNAEFDVDFILVEKVIKKSHKKVIKKSEEKMDYRVQKFSASNFLCVNFFANFEPYCLYH
jgi:hypothetical protein